MGIARTGTTGLDVYHYVTLHWGNLALRGHLTLMDRYKVVTARGRRVMLAFLVGGDPGHC